MALSLRCRGPNGQYTLSGIDSTMLLSDFLTILAEKTGVAQSRQEILAGFPPKVLEIPAEHASTPLSSLPIQSGDTIVVRERSGAAEAEAPAAASIPNGASFPSPSGLPLAPSSQEDSLPYTQQQQQQSIEDAELAAAIAASLSDGALNQGTASTSAATHTNASAAPIASHPPPPPSSFSRTAASQGATPTAAPVRGGGGSQVVRRVIESDNSCLFNAVGYVMDGSRQRASVLRQVIVDAVRGDPFTYNEAFLAMDNDKYCSWILKRDSWGGAIELSILSSHFKREIAAYDIQTRRVDLYGQDQGYNERVMLLYDGLHYDALAVSPIKDGPEEFDQTKFEPTSSEAAQIQEAAQLLVQASHEARQFTNTAEFTLRCGVCQIGLKGEKEATQHAKATGHANFQEY